MKENDWKPWTEARAVQKIEGFGEERGGLMCHVA